MPNTTPAPIGADALRPIITWLDNGCDPKQAAEELRLLVQRADALASAAQPEREPHPPHRDCGCAECAPSFETDAAAPKAAPALAAVARPLNELEELNLLNKLIHLGARAASAHAKSNSDDGHAGTAAYVEWSELRADMGELIRMAYAASTPSAQGDASPTMPKDIEMMATNRYRPVPSGMLAYKVVGGDGNRSLFSGTKDECQIVARKLTEAFLDGAHVARSTQPAAPAAQGDALDAARWRMLPAFFYEYQIDALKLFHDIDAAIAARAAKEGGKP